MKKRSHTIITCTIRIRFKHKSSRHALTGRAYKYAHMHKPTNSHMCTNTVLDT